MSRRSLNDSDPRTLARMLSVDGEEETGAFADNDVAAMIRHQLNSSLATQLELVCDRRMTTPPPGTFRELLSVERPQAFLLEEVKTFSKRMRGETSGAAQTVATVLYFAAIAAALVRCEMRISELSSAQLKEGFAWAGELSSGDSTLTALFSAAIARAAQV